MRFGKILTSHVVEALPGWRDKYLAYKRLKKWLNLVGGARPRAGPPRSKRRRVEGAARRRMARVDAWFVILLDAELHKLNDFFLDKEEDYVILQKELQSHVARAVALGSPEERAQVKKKVVDFHGEMVLLQNYSALNYTGLVKILKKYDKRTGALIRLPFIQKVLQQPFFTTDLLDKLVRDCEVMLEQLATPNEPSVPPTPSGAGAPEPGLGEDVESMHMKSTVAAFRALREIRSGSSTVSVFSLPPLHGGNGHHRH